MTLQGYPAGACGDAAVMLGRYLKAGGFGRSDYVAVWRIDGEARASDAWLRFGDVDVDEFPEIKTPVVVRPRSEWHAPPDGEVLHEGDYRVYDAHARATMHGALGVAVAQLAGDAR